MEKTERLDQKWTSNFFYGKLADEAESGFKKNNLRPAYRSSANGSVARSDGSLCNTPAEITERWRENYQNTLNHSIVTPSADLDDFADSAIPDVTVSEDVPMLHEVIRAIRRLKNGRAAGADGITAELLNGAEKPISEALNKVTTNVWFTGRVPAEWRRHYRLTLQGQRIAV